jgi:hypothetical protein
MTTSDQIPSRVIKIEPRSKSDWSVTRYLLTAILQQFRASLPEADDGSEFIPISNLGRSTISTFLLWVFTVLTTVVKGSSDRASLIAPGVLPGRYGFRHELAPRSISNSLTI